METLTVVVIACGNTSYHSISTFDRLIIIKNFGLFLVSCQIPTMELFTKMASITELFSEMVKL